MTYHARTDRTNGILRRGLALLKISFGTVVELAKNSHSQVVIRQIRNLWNETPVGNGGHSLLVSFTNGK